MKTKPWEVMLFLNICFSQTLKPIINVTLGGVGIKLWIKSVPSPVLFHQVRAKGVIRKWGLSYNCICRNFYQGLLTLRNWETSFCCFLSSVVYILLLQSKWNKIGSGRSSKTNTEQKEWEGRERRNNLFKKAKTSPREILRKMINCNQIQLELCPEEEKEKAVIDNPATWKWGWQVEKKAKHHCFFLQGGKKSPNCIGQNIYA